LILWKCDIRLEFIFRELHLEESGSDGGINVFFYDDEWEFCFVLFSSTRVFLLGPSHHYYTPKCALSTAAVYKTPIGDLPIDLEGTIQA
jgi:hypothetical protein